MSGSKNGQHMSSNIECLFFCEHQLLCKQQTPRCAADIPEVWYMLLHLAVTNVAIVRFVTAILLR